MKLRLFYLLLFLCNQNSFTMDKKPTLPNLPRLPESERVDYDPEASRTENAENRNAEPEDRSCKAKCTKKKLLLLFCGKSLAKSLTWRVIASTITAVISYALTKNVGTAFAIGGAEFAAKTVCYVGHEFIWDARCCKKLTGACKEKCRCACCGSEE